MNHSLAVDDITTMSVTEMIFNFQFAYESLIVVQKK